MKTAAFWREKTLEQMSQKEWESLCDGCGKCCLHKLEDEDDGTLYFTNVACRLLDEKSCQCKSYPNRKTLVPDCVQLTAKNIHQFNWLPSSCAYRRLASGKDLPAWHPLITGDPQSTRRAGMSMAGRILSEDEVDDLEHHIIAWFD